MSAPPFVQRTHNNHNALVVCIHFIQRFFWEFTAFYFEMDSPWCPKLNCAVLRWLLLENKDSLS